ncbi:MAG: methylmalonyl-CoA epimerase [Gemmatimonadetes bacterium]|nr:methylmalonyl-CoA epimerase [Gemmatimonadota bacterium]
MVEFPHDKKPGSPKTPGESPRWHGIDHLGLAVPDLDEARDVFTRLLGFEVVEEEEVPDQRVKVVKLDAGGSDLELLQSTDPDGPIGRYVAKRGAGIHHLTVRVENLAERLRELEARGVELIDREPRTGAGGKKIAFLHPRSTAGILIELCEVDGA